LEGAHQLGKFVQACGMSYSVVTAKDLHLKTSIAYGGSGLLICTEEYNSDEEFLQVVAPLTEKIVVVPKEESYAANCLRVNDTLLLASGFQVIHEELSKHRNVVTLEMSEFRKMDGGLTCLSVLI
jgi:dimethylargininase